MGYYNLLYIRNVAGGQQTVIADTVESQGMCERAISKGKRGEVKLLLREGMLRRLQQ